VKVLFLDESGDHNLSAIDPQYPLFVLGGVIIDRAYAEGPLVAAFDRFKRAHFGRTDIVLHTADIVRNRNGFEGLKDPVVRMRFLGELNALVASLEFSVVACAIRKDHHLARYGVAALDPYLLSLDLLVERFCFDLRSSRQNGLIVAEQRDATLDRQLDLAWLNLKVQGTRYVSATEITASVDGLTLRPKRANIAGLQLADLVVSPIGRHVLGKADKPDWSVVEAKLRRDRAGRSHGFGLVVLPK
jgi:Protein of unknown function (DUF3800)